MMKRQTNLATYETTLVMLALALFFIIQRGL
jgi:hypothetical protein